MKPTPEQAEGIRMSLALKPGQIAVGNAYAGTGKTTTAGLISAAAENIGWRVLYVCFNAAMAEEARGRFSSTVTCKTAHSLAYKTVGHRYASKNMKDGSPKLGGSIRYADVRRLTGLNGADSMTVINALNEFLASQDATPSIDHVPALESGLGISKALDRRGILKHLVAVWRAMVDETSDTPMTHDGYLKLWVNDRPSLPYDLIIVDEAQDLNPVLLQLIAQQSEAGKRVLLIGDTHQSIYGFRKATNAMRWAHNQAAASFQLTESWRFGPATAHAASVLLTEYKHDQVLLRGLGPKKGHPQEGAKKCILARTNGNLLMRALDEIKRGRKVHFAATTNRDGWSPRSAYKFAEFEDAASLYLKQPAASLRSPLIRQFSDWQELKDAGDQDPELDSITRFVEEVGAAQIPSVLAKLEEASVDPAAASLYFSSAHRAKGKEWTRVELLNDFLPLDDPEKIAGIIEEKGAAAFAEEVNLLYVAITRGCEGFTPYENASIYFSKIMQNAVAAAPLPAVQTKSNASTVTENAAKSYSSRRI